MEYLFVGLEILTIKDEDLKFIPPTNDQIREWLILTEGKLDTELCKFLNIKSDTKYEYKGKLTVAQRAYIYHNLNN